MSYGTLSGDLVCIGTYQKADDWWHKAPKCRSSKMDNNNEKSLHPRKPSSFPHYLLRRGPNADYYDLLLYKTTMCRLFRNNADGTYEVWYAHTGSQTDTHFLNAVSPYYHRQMTTEGFSAFVPLKCTRARMEEFSAKCVYTASGLLIRDKSWHWPHGRFFMTKETRDARKDIVKLAEPYITMALVGRDNLDIYADHTCITRNDDYKYNLDWLRKEPTEEIINGIMRLAHDLKRSWERLHREWVWTDKNSRQGEYKHVPMPDDVLRKGIIAQIHSLNQYTNTQNGWEEKPMFVNADDYPKTGLTFKATRI